MAWRYKDLRRLPGSRAFFSTPPFYFSKKYAEENGCDIAVPNRGGIGNILMTTRLVEDYAKACGRPITLLTGPICPDVGVTSDEEPYPIWKNNPFLEKIIDAEKINQEIMEAVSAEIDNCCQFNHVIENTLIHYGLRPSALRASLFLSNAEMVSALYATRNIRRPLVILHPGGTTSPPESHAWNLARWKEVVEKCGSIVGFLQVAKGDYDAKDIDIPHFHTTLREAMALIWAADGFIGFDSGLNHIARAFQKRSVVLWEPSMKLVHEEAVQYSFGPAVTLRWAYPENRNLLLLGERGDEIVLEIQNFCADLRRNLYRETKA